MARNAPNAHRIRKTDDASIIVDDNSGRCIIYQIT